jgi:sugar lactone lactonase YvrE
LSRTEDGVVLSDGRIVVVDQKNGLTIINADESTRPFGKFAEAGYLHAPPASLAGPNGVTLEPDGANLLVADVFTGAIYRVNIATEATQKIYAHAFGVNTAVRDSTGAIRSPLIAIARKLIVAANAILKHGEPWKPAQRP